MPDGLYGHRAYIVDLPSLLWQSDAVIRGEPNFMTSVFRHNIRCQQQSAASSPCLCEHLLSHHVFCPALQTVSTTCHYRGILKRPHTSIIYSALTITNAPFRQEHTHVALLLQLKAGLIRPTPPIVNVIANEMRHITLTSLIHKAPHTGLASKKC